MASTATRGRSPHPRFPYHACTSAVGKRLRDPLLCEPQGIGYMFDAEPVARQAAPAAAPAAATAPD